MKGHPSITRRLIASLIVVELALLLATFLGALFYNQLGSTHSAASELDAYSEYHARSLLAQSIVRSADGERRIEPSADLRDYARERPSFRFAAFDPTSRRPIAGSDPKLVAYLSHVDRIQIDSTKFHIADDGGDHRQGYMKMQATPAGDAMLAVYGYVYGPGDLIFNIKNALDGFLSHTTLLLFSPLIVGSVAMALLVVRHGVAPLGRAVASAERIDLDSLDQRLETAAVPVEIMPLVVAVNAALARVDAGVARQRRFIANAAHELRTPVAVLNARIDAPRKPDFDVEIKRDVRRIRNIVEQLLVASRLGERPEEMNQEVDLVEAAQAQVADHTLLALKAGRQIEFEAPRERVLVRGSRRAIETIVANLVDNALRAEPAGGMVLVSVGADASISIVDHGAGVEKADREAVFEAFWRKSEATPGTGLGLAIVRELAQLHGGSVTMKETLGGGATFEVRLTRLEPPTAACRPQAPL
ncbi:sensor histidine kinase [Methylosinus sp. LW4]|uniref:sensor histidine kinase n=1 Tax=Methylosinus sp. LW4 TaxID=136993 RepID=UPI00035EF453|nr:HAMP domain-containing sensor histidine kinase [Methylosinus sp. LW4]